MNIRPVTARYCMELRLIYLNRWLPAKGDRDELNEMGVVSEEWWTPVPSSRHEPEPKGRENAFLRQEPSHDSGSDWNFSLFSWSVGVLLGSTDVTEASFRLPSTFGSFQLRVYLVEYRLSFGVELFVHCGTCLEPKFEVTDFDLELKPRGPVSFLS